MTRPWETAATLPARFELKAVGAVAGAVDGVWWPRSRDLPDELLQAYAMARARISHVERVCYRFSNWDPAPRSISIGGDLVRLEGFVTQELDTVRFVGTDGVLLLALIPPESEPDVAQLASLLAMTGAAAQPAHGFNVDAEKSATATHQLHVAERAWEDEGGHAPPSPRSGRRTSRSAPAIAVAHE